MYYSCIFEAICKHMINYIPNIFTRPVFTAEQILPLSMKYKVSCNFLLDF